MWVVETIYTDKLSGNQHVVYVEHDKQLSRYYVKKRPTLTDASAKIITHSAHKIHLWQREPETIPEIVIDYPLPTDFQLEPILRKYPHGTTRANDLRYAALNHKGLERYTATITTLAVASPDMHIAIGSTPTQMREELERLRNLRYVDSSSSVVQTIEGLQIRSQSLEEHIAESRRDELSSIDDPFAMIDEVEL
jgi:hypothetical protein